MSENTDSGGVPYEPTSPTEATLWRELGELERHQPSPELRRGFYRDLRRRDADGPLARLAGWLRPALAFAVALGLGFGLGRLVPAGPAGPVSEIAALRAEVQTLSRGFALAMLQDDSASERLRGVTLIADLAPGDGEATRALLAAATNDPIAAVRGAALDALGPRLDEPVVAQRVSWLLLETDSVLVQLSVADLLMRWGDDTQVQQLVDAAEHQALFPDVSRFVLERVRRTRA